jgi:hypothetical protein
VKNLIATAVGRMRTEGSISTGPKRRARFCAWYDDTGTYRDGKFVLRHYSTACAALIVVTPKGDEGGGTDSRISTEKSRARDYRREFHRTAGRTACASCDPF